ncbi:MAG: CoA pyrophosphatase [Deltaproteobacteria bacterium]|nr:CoA pyrophosphatase [Deltaproteobacteria bacterium]
MGDGASARFETGTPLVDLDRLARRLSARAPVRYSGVEPKRRSAVAAVLRDRLRGSSSGVGAGPEVLLIRRTERAGDPWSGHMAMPGGRADPEDADDLATAIRETEEEVGLRLGSDARFLGALDDLPTLGRLAASTMVVAPMVFVLERDPGALEIDETEVAEALWVPLGPMIRGEVATEHVFVHDGAQMRLPAFAHEGRVVWGLTYRILTTLLDLTRSF